MENLEKIYYLATTTTNGDTQTIEGVYFAPSLLFAFMCALIAVLIMILFIYFKTREI